MTSNENRGPGAASPGTSQDNRNQEGASRPPADDRTPREALMAMMPDDNARHRLAAEMRDMPDDDPLWSLGYSIALIAREAHRPAATTIKKVSTRIDGSIQSFDRAMEQIERQETESGKRVQEIARQLDQNAADAVKQAAEGAARQYTKEATDYVNRKLDSIDSHMDRRIAELDKHMDEKINNEFDGLTKEFQRVSDKIGQQKLGKLNESIEEHMKGAVNKHLTTRVLSTWSAAVGAVIVSMGAGAVIAYLVMQ